MGSGHTHAAPLPKGATPTAAGKHKRRLQGALGLTAGLMVVEGIGAWATGSLALLADAAHMLTDAGGLALALVAIQFSERPATPAKTYGYARTEVLAALANAVVLLLLAGYILLEAYHRFVDPPQITGWPMLAVASVGLVVNLISMRLLMAGAEESLNVKGAYLEVFSDTLGSIGVIVAAIVVLTTGWTVADAIIGAGIGLFIVPRTWALLKSAIHILMEGTPPDVDVTLLEARLMALPGVEAVHDLHVWTITSGLDAMSCHLVVDDTALYRATLQAAHDMMRDEFGIKKTTIQIEPEGLHMVADDHRHHDHDH